MSPDAPLPPDAIAQLQQMAGGGAPSPAPTPTLAPSPAGGDPLGAYDQATQEKIKTYAAKGNLSVPDAIAKLKAGGYIK